VCHGVRVVRAGDVNLEGECRSRHIATVRVAHEHDKEVCAGGGRPCSDGGEGAAGNVKPAHLVDIEGGGVKRVEQSDGVDNAQRYSRCISGIKKTGASSPLADFLRFLERSTLGASEFLSRISFGIWM